MCGGDDDDDDDRTSAVQHCIVFYSTLPTRALKDSYPIPLLPSPLILPSSFRPSLPLPLSFPLSGFSTIIKIITGELNPPEGEVRRNPRLRVGIYNQVRCGYTHSLLPFIPSSHPLTFHSSLYPFFTPSITLSCI